MQFLSLVAFSWYVFCRFMYNKCIYICISRIQKF